MKGSYHITVSNATVRYDFTIRRNITVIKGDSATGKTTLVEMIQEHYESEVGSGVTLNCNVSCRVIGGRDWKTILDTIHGSIVFIDENNEFLPTDAFARAVRDSDNYYVLVTREGLPNLPYSVEEIYGIRESGKYAGLKPVYNEFYHFYGFENDQDELPPSCLITEDSNSGYEFFRAVASGDDCNVISADGKSNIFKEVMSCGSDSILVIADGAAFGSEIDRLMQLVKQKHGRLILYLPESFEWIILRSGLIDGKKVQDILSAPEEYIESSDFFSWEQFFTKLLQDLTANTYQRYQKSHLNKYYLQDGVKARIIKSIERIHFSEHL